MLTVLFLLNACNSPHNGDTSTLTPTSHSPETTTITIPTSQPTPAVKITRIWADPDIPDNFKYRLTIPTGWEIANQADQADMSLSFGRENQVSTWIYALVAPFPTLVDQVSSQDLTNAWQYGSREKIGAAHILVTQNTRDVLENLLGTPDPSLVTTLPSDQIEQRAWTENSWAIVPFEELNPKWKVLEIDGQSPIHKSFSLKEYLLTIPLSLMINGSGSPENRNEYIQLLNIPPINRDPGKMTIVILTGVTALVRATGAMMELRGITYPGEEIRNWLRDADITHVSNEIAFSPTCPVPRGEQDGLKFCSRPKYIGLLEDIGTDVVDLSGDHFSDWGDDAVIYSLDLYNQKGFKVFGGGYNLEEGRKPVTFEHNGNRLIFTGCNAKAPGYAHASSSTPGSVHCDMEWMKKEVSRYKTDGYLPIVTLQHIEYVDSKPRPELQNDFRAMAESGAVIVSGTQAHQPMTMEFYKDSFIHYGLGNLFFDQYYEGLPMRQAFIDRHIFYDGKYISTELLTTIFIDFAKPIPMTQDERKNLLNEIFSKSTWH